MSGYPSDLALNVKLLPRNSIGVLPIASAAEMSITTTSRYLKPLPPGNVRLNNLAYAAWPATTTGDVSLSWSHRNRLSQGVGQPLVAQDVAGTYTVEGTVTVAVYIDGTLKRTWAGLTSTSQAYTLEQRTADNADLTKPVHFTITPVNGIYSGTTRTTPSFVMG